eukprot:TRINITY_DN260_c0_g1_i1.p1 TRINITY_DN260_c0_g1~~TRINITY_DN260_c0_g1_i1.p1  ORF type:complete len:268 (-),score=26.09 TRINITY_DN260_c0_g1_i1:207-1010(-)
METKKRQDAYLGRQFLFDTVSASVAGFLVTPYISAIDRALAENASGKRKLFPSLLCAFKEMGLHPWKFVRSPACFWIWVTYASTYVAANWADTVCERLQKNPAFPRWLATSVAHSLTCICKDRAYARLFGMKLPTHVPFGSYTCWLIRDAVSMWVFFNLPSQITKFVSRATGSTKSAYYSSQFLLPLILQFVTTPIHLLGYDVYNHPKNTTRQRLSFLTRDYSRPVFLRMFRMIAPWSLGIPVNKELRTYLFQKYLPGGGATATATP